LAIYVPDSTRRRRAVLLAAGCLVAGLVLGALVGRATAPSIDDEVRSVQAQAADAATALQRLPIEYEQLLSGDGESAATVNDAIDSAQAQLREAYDGAIWLGDTAPASTDAALDTLREVVAGEGSADEFAAAVDEAVSAIEERFAVSVG
jgi:hypothetical protein